MMAGAIRHYAACPCGWKEVALVQLVAEDCAKAHHKEYPDHLVTTYSKPRPIYPVDPGSALREDDQ